MGVFHIYPIYNGKMFRDGGMIMQVTAENEADAIKKAKKHISNPRYFTTSQRNIYYKNIGCVRVL